MSLPRFHLLYGLAVIALWLGGCIPWENKEACEDILPLACEEGVHPPQPGAIQQASAFMQGDKLYARAELDPLYLKKIMGLLRHGEPILATYRFRFYRLHTWLPNLRLGHIILKRRLRLRLITRRYEMLDVQSGEIQYTGNPEEAMEFLGAPNYVPLGQLPDNAPGEKKKQLSADYAYRLNVDLTMEHEGMLHIFRMLDLWSTLGQSGGFSFQSAYQP